MTKFFFNEELGAVIEVPKKNINIFNKLIEKNKVEAFVTTFRKI